MTKLILITFFGVLSTLIVVVGFRYWNFTRSLKNQIETFYTESNKKTTIVTAEMLHNLPAPVRRYLIYSGVIGKPIPRIVYLRQAGKMRQNPGASWMRFEANEYYSTNPPSFLWNAVFPSRTIPFVLGIDQYSDNKGKMTISLLSLMSVVDATGNEIDQGALMRYLNEMMWFPAAFLGDNISWEEIDDTSAEVTLTNKNNTATAVLYFDAEGRLINFVAKRYRTVGKTYELETWSTPLAEYGEFEGLRLPIKGKAIWQLDSGDFEYIELEILDIQYH